MSIPSSGVGASALWRSSHREVVFEPERQELPANLGAGRGVPAVGGGKELDWWRRRIQVGVVSDQGVGKDGQGRLADGQPRLDRVPAERVLHARPPLVRPHGDAGRRGLQPNVSVVLARATIE